MINQTIDTLPKGMIYMSGKTKAEDISFEKNISELEEIVKKLENNEISLDESLKLFERGVKLSSECSKMIDEAEQKVAVLLKTENGIKEQNFLAGDDDKNDL